MTRKPPSRLEIEVGSWLLLATVAVAFGALCLIFWE